MQGLGAGGRIRARCWARIGLDTPPSGRPARCFAYFRWTTRESWSRRRRVVAKAERMPDRGARSANPRFVVTSPNALRADVRTLYEQMYRARGEMENRIKECQLDLFAEIGVPITPDCAPDPQPPRPSFNANNAPHHTHRAEAQCAAVSDPCAAVARGSLIPSLAACTKVPVRNAG
jgi:hypothetical protein